jgi:hypothetical protein
MRAGEIAPAEFVRLSAPDRHAFVAHRSANSGLAGSERDVAVDWVEVERHVGVGHVSIPEAPWAQFSAFTVAGECGVIAAMVRSAPVAAGWGGLAWTIGPRSGWVRG